MVYVSGRSAVYIVIIFNYHFHGTNGGCANIKHVNSTFNARYFGTVKTSALDRPLAKQLHKT